MQPVAMQSLVTTALQAAVLTLLLAGAACFAILVKGCVAVRRLARESRREDNATLLKSRLVPAVSAIAAPPDSSAESRALARLLVGLHFGNHEVVLALDGPGDAELAAWREEFRLADSLRRIAGALPMGKVRSVLESSDPIRLTAIVLERCGPALALNAAVNAAQSPVIGWFGPECEFPPEALLRLIPPMLEEPGSTIAVCGAAPAATASGMFSQFAALDFLRGWLGLQAALSDWNLLLPPRGSAILIAREYILKAGGFRGDALDLILRLHVNARASKQPYRIAFVPGAGCRQRAARSLAELREAGARDRRDMAQVMLTAGLPAWLRLGCLWLGVLRPLVETAAYVLTLIGLAAGWVAWPLAYLALLSTVGTGMLLSMAAASLRELAEDRGSDPARLTRLFLAAIPENLWFRQLRNAWPL